MKIDITRSWQGLLQNITATMLFSKKGQFEAKKVQGRRKTGQKQTKTYKK